MNNCQCFYCNRKPEEIAEVRLFSSSYGMEPLEYVKSEEGTFDPATGFFACDSCYIKAGTPPKTVLLSLYKYRKAAQR